MKFKLDENIPDEVLEPLRQLGHDVHSVRDEGLCQEADPGVWAAAQREGRFFVTQDHYFSDIRHHPPGTHAGVMLVRLSQTGRRKMIDRVQEIIEGHEVDRWAGCVVVANENHVRVRKP